MNETGCKRIRHGLVILEQNMKNVEPSFSLARIARLLELYSAGPDVITGISRDGKENKHDFSYEELKALIELCYSEAINSNKREVASVAQTNLNDHLLQLSEHMWQS